MLISANFDKWKAEKKSKISPDESITITVGSHTNEIIIKSYLLEIISANKGGFTLDGM